jgi:NADH-quinone oxidoreductase subunit N
MMQSQFDFALAAPEIFLTVMGMLILILDACSQAPRRALAYGLSLATLVPDVRETGVLPATRTL